MMKAALQTISNHIENIELMVKAFRWGKNIEECLTEIKKSASVIRTRVEYLAAGENKKGDGVKDKPESYGTVGIYEEVA